MYILAPYDDALRQILSSGIHKTNRTGTETLSIFGMQCRYRIDECFPVLTGRKVWPKAVFAELLWFISGSTNNSDLKKLGADFWTPWVDPEFEKKHYYAEGSFGPVYGFQLRHFGGYYGNGLKDQKHLGENIYGKNGFDQLAYIVNLLKTQPDSRRILFSLWNPSVLDKMRLPPCHYTFQLFTHDGKLSGMLTQRSCDYPVGVPANIQFYSALIYLLAQQTGFQPYEFIHTTADSHIYKDQIAVVEEYLSREKPDSPKLEIRQAPSIYEYDIDDFNLKDYNPLSPIKIPVAV